MNRLLRLFSVFVLLFFSATAYAQNGGITGTLKDDKGQPVVNAQVEVTTGGMVRGQEITDYDGNYAVRSLDAGNYTVKFTYLKNISEYTGIVVVSNQIAKVNGVVATGVEIKGTTVRTSRVGERPILNLDAPAGVAIKAGDEIDRAPTHNTADLAGLSTQVVQTGGGLGIGGGRPGTGTSYIIDGVRLPPGQSAFTNLPPNGIESIATYSSGVPARLGDASGGLVELTTKGATARTQGNVQYEHSIEGFNQNQLTLNLSGPLLRRYDSAFGGKRSILGYSLSADGVYADDNNPVYDKTYYIKDARLAELQAHPLIPISTQGVTRLEYASQFLKESDLELRRKQPNAKFLRGTLGGKLDFSLSNNISVRLGTSYFTADQPEYNREYSLYSSDAFRRTQSQTGRGYIRLTQKFGNAKNGAADSTNPISNASYTVQADYQKDYSTTQDPTKKHNTFDYGYIGKFDELYTPDFQAGGIDPATGKVGVRLVGYRPVGVLFTPGTQNPTLANYTRDFYAFNPNPQQQSDVLAGRGLRNGDVPARTYGLFRNIGTSNRYGWTKTNNDQVAIAIDAAFDFKQKRASGGTSRQYTTHSIQFGLYYQQQNRRNYTVNGGGLWGLMRQLSARVVSPNEVDPRFAKFVIGGKEYDYTEVLAGNITPGPNDTILYQRKFDTAAQTAFDRHLRAKLLSMGQISSDRSYINTDGLDPSMYSLDLFSADDLLNSGNSLIDYQGYDYTGKPVNGQVNFNDFWTKKDAEGYYTRPIGAYRPIYIAGYLSDYIQYKDFRITLGVRVERFDNNTKVLKDPYTLSAAKTAGEIPNLDRPSNIGSDFVAYVGDNGGANPTVIGYRNGDVWYNQAGTEVEDPQVIRTSTGSNGLQPYLQNSSISIKDSAFDPNTVFTDYKPIVNAMPRINFSFPLSEKAIFYAHYDIMYQRPTGAYSSPTDYFFREENPTRIYENSNLRPERAVDYEVGFVQQLSDVSGLTISGFYKERKDQIQVRPFLYAYPTTYYAYGNRDFSTYKGLSMSYEQRRFKNTPLSMTINYTLSFTEGTGSSATSANGGDANNISGSGQLTQLIAAGLPNLRPQFPVDYDSRHNLNAQIDYRYRQDEGPTFGGKHFLQNSGIQLIFRTRSGEPYTKYQRVQNIQDGAANSRVIEGTINGSRIPWHYGFDVNVNKSFPLTYKTIKNPDGKGNDIRVPGRMSMNIYAYSRNIFNIREIIRVYGYTGRADDDGYLTSTDGLGSTATQINPASFQTQYSAYSQNPNNFGSPRLIFIGASLNF